MIYYLDAEFCEVPGQIELISIALVAEDGREYHTGVHHRVDWCQHNNPWLIDNVYPHLTDVPWVDRPTLKSQIEDFTRDPSNPEFWGYFADYDWVVFAWIFGKMIDLPEHYPKYCRDLKQLADELGVRKQEFPPQPQNAHNALADARWNKELHHFLMEQRSSHAAAGN